MEVSLVGDFVEFVPTVAAVAGGMGATDGVVDGKTCISPSVTSLWAIHDSYTSSTVSTVFRLYASYLLSTACTWSKSIKSLELYFAFVKYSVVHVSVKTFFSK